MQEEKFRFGRFCVRDIVIGGRQPYLLNRCDLIRLLTNGGEERGAKAYCKTFARNFILPLNKTWASETAARMEVATSRLVQVWRAPQFSPSLKERSTSPSSMPDFRTRPDLTVVLINDQVHQWNPLSASRGLMFSDTCTRSANLNTSPSPMLSASGWRVA